MKISILSNINMDVTIKKLSKEYNVYKVEGYNTWGQELFNPKSKLYSYSPKAIFLMLDGEELVRGKNDINDIKSEIDNYFLLIKKTIEMNKNIFFFVATIDIPFKKLFSMKTVRQEVIIEQYWHRKLIELNSRYEHFVIFHLKDIISEIGRKNFYSAKLWYLASIKYSPKAEEILIKEITRSIKAIEGKKKKCLVLDLDNTLWGGIIGEDNIDGIKLSEFKEGARYKDFQKRIKELKDLGVILTVASKNNLEDAKEVFQNHEHMLLKEDDFTTMKINWNLKTENIKEISKELNIGLDSLVFIDDNPVERDSIKNELTEVLVVDFPVDTSDLEKLIIEVYKDYFLTIKLTEEDKKKTIMYKENHQREMAKQMSASFEDFLNSLNTTVKIWHAKEADVERIVQLTQKTNQFNLTTQRYTKADILNFLGSENYYVYSISIDDKYGDNGIVSVAILEKIQDKTVFIDTFLMSCRVMGRFVEDDIIEYIENCLQKKGYNKIISKYSVTEKNKPVENLYERLGYTILEQDEFGNKKYMVSLKNKDISKRKYFSQVVML